MKKIVVSLLFCASASVSCSSFKLSSLKRLGLFGIFRQAQRPATVLANRTSATTEAQSSYPLYTNKKMAMREFFPTQPSPASAVARNGLSAVWASLVGFRNSFKTFYTPDPQRQELHLAQAAAHNALEDLDLAMAHEQPTQSNRACRG